MIVVAASIFAPVYARAGDDPFKVYAVNVVKTTPFEKPFTGDGIYLGNGAVITAAHVIGRWGFLKNPHVLIAGQSLPAKIIKEGSIEQTDVTLLSVDDSRIPDSLRLRRNPLCKQPSKIGDKVAIVAPEKTNYSQIISPLLIPWQLRERFSSIVSDVGESGSGVFDAVRKCLLGIISRKVVKFDHRGGDEGIVALPSGFAGYFVPASEIALFIPPEFQF
jgi:hypothetical protein